MQTAQPDGKGMYDVPSAMDVAWMCMWPPLDYAPHPLMMATTKGLANSLSSAF